MKNILFVIDSLICGGAEKSLISLLNNMDFSRFNVDLLMISKGGEFEKLLPKEVNVLDIPEYFSFLNDKTIKIKLYKKIIYGAYRIKTSLRLRINDIKKNGIHSEQIVFDSIRNILSELDKVYDVAIAYNQGFPTYLVSEKIKARKKIAWINCDYVKTKYDKDKDSKFYKNIDKMIVVSEFLYESISNMKYPYKEKLKIVLDIIDPSLINKMADIEVAKELNNIKEMKLLTVGRLAEVKGYDLLVKTAKLLKDNDYKFKWFIIGEGQERANIERQIIENDLLKEVILLGARANPYPYMKKCDLYVQTSRKEGFGLSVMEAKILKNIIITTNFETAKELINDGVDGFIVEKDTKEIFEKIETIMSNHSKILYLKENLEKLKPYSTVSEIEKVYEELV